MIIYLITLKNHVSLLVIIYFLGALLLTFILKFICIKYIPVVSLDICKMSSKFAVICPSLFTGNSYVYIYCFLLLLLD